MRALSIALSGDMSWVHRGWCVRWVLKGVFSVLVQCVPLFGVLWCLQELKQLCPFERFEINTIYFGQLTSTLTSPVSNSPHFMHKLVIVCDLLSMQQIGIIRSSRDLYKKERNKGTAPVFIYKIATKQITCPKS